MNAEHHLPRSVEELTAEWFSAALSRGRPPVQVISAEVEQVIWGTATKAFVRLAYESGGEELPDVVCVKGGLEERVREYDLGLAYQLEGLFFPDVADALDVPLPRTYYAEAEPEQGIVVFEDLRGTEFGDATKPWSVDRAAVALEVMATWHGSTWGKGVPGADWLPIGCTPARATIAVMLDGDHYDALIGREEIPPLSDGLRDAARVGAGYRELRRRDDAGAHCLNHGDAHLAQTYLTADGSPAFLDWQVPCLTSWAHDVAYFLGSAVSIVDRRTNERELLEHYLDALARSGGRRPDSEEAWADYRRHTLHGYAWLLTPAIMQPPEVVAAMASRYAAALEDHDPLSLLGV